MMTNHIHLLLESVDENGSLAYFMKHITQRHTQHIDKYDKRSGTLWEGRFKSSPVFTDRYLLACNRYIEYIELNCVRVGMAKAPEDYPFCYSQGRLLCLDERFYGSPLTKTQDSGAKDGVSNRVKNKPFRI